jgi:hypothetical protein
VDLYEGQALLIASDLALLRGEVDGVETRLVRASEIFAPRSAQDEQVLVELLRARLEWARGEPVEARRRLLAAAARARELGLLAVECEAGALIAELLLEIEPASAASPAAATLARARQLGLRETVWRCERVLGRLALQRGDRRQAAARYEAVLAEMRALCTGLDEASADACLQHPLRRRVFAELEAVRRGTAS